MRTDARSAVVAAVAAAALIVVPAATAKIWFQSVRGETFRAGDVVRTEILGCPNPCPVRGARIALGRGRTPLGRVRPVTSILATVDRRGHVAFRIPRVRDGAYHLVARFRGRWLAASDAFHVAAAG